MRKTLHVGAVFLVLAVGGCAERPTKTDDTLVINHRSGRVFAPPETNEAFCYSICAGADAVDVDVRLTADNVLVCCHDGVVLTRNVFGPVELLDWPTLAEAEVGWEFGERFADQHVLTLDEVVRFCAENKVRLHLESKAGRGILPQVLKVIDRYHAIGLVTELQGLPRPDRADYVARAASVNTMNEGGDDDRWVMRALLAKRGSKPLVMNVDDPRAVADVLDRDRGRRLLVVRVDTPPLLPLGGLEELGDVLSTGSDREALAAINDIFWGTSVPDVREVDWPRRSDTVEALRAGAVSGRSSVVRAAALWALGTFKDNESLPLLEKAALAPPGRDEWIVHQASVWAVSELDLPESVGVLDRVVELGLGGKMAKKREDGEWIAEDALRALGRMKRPAAVEVLARVLISRPANRYVTEAAAAALARSGPLGIRPLIACLDEDRPAHRREILWALIRMQPESIPSVLDALATTESDVVRRNALRVLGWCNEIPVSAAPMIIPSLDSKNAEVRGEAAWCCGKHKMVAAAAKLKQLTTDEDENVRLDAAQALKRMGR